MGRNTRSRQVEPNAAVRFSYQTAIEAGLVDVLRDAVFASPNEETTMSVTDHKELLKRAAQAFNKIEQRSRA